MLNRRRIAGFLAVIFATTWVPQIAFGAIESGSSGKSISLAQAVRRSILVFPVDVKGANVPAKEEVSNLLTDVVRSRLIASDAYTVTSFHRSLAPVARLHNDQQLSDTDVNEPFAEDNAKATKVARLAGYDIVFIGSVDNYAVTDGAGEMTLSGRIIEVGTNRIVRSATLTHSTAKNAAAPEIDRVMDASRGAGEKLATQMAPQIVRPPVTTTPTAPTRKPSTRKRNDWLLAILGVAVIAGIASSASGGSGAPQFGSPGGNGGGGGGGDFPPPPPQ
jgi:hypothetical protein